MKRKSSYILASVLILAGCTSRELTYDGSRPPLDLQTQIPIASTFPAGSWRPNMLVYGEVTDNREIPQEGTIELSNSLFAKQDNEDVCDDSFADGAACVACYIGCAPLGLAAALVYLPILAAKGELTNDKVEEPIPPRQLRAQWLASVVEDRRWAPELDNAYISGMSRALGWKAQDGPPPAPSFWSAPETTTFYVHVSKVVLLDNTAGERTLLLCARSTIRLKWGAMPRTIETCQGGPIGATDGVGTAGDSPASRDALRATLVERAKQLAGIQAREICPSCTPVQ